MIRHLGYGFCLMAALYGVSMGSSFLGWDVPWFLFLVIGGVWALRHPSRPTVNHDYSKDW
jgi:hypothetical protein